MKKLLSNLVLRLDEHAQNDSEIHWFKVLFYTGMWPLMNPLLSFCSHPQDRATDRLSLLHTAGTIREQFWNILDVMDGFFPPFPLPAPLSHWRDRGFESLQVHWITPRDGGFRFKMSTECYFPSLVIFLSLLSNNGADVVQLVCYSVD
jgi:hypothetical protein